MRPRTGYRARWSRWPANLGIVIVGTLLVRVLFPTAAIAVATTAGEQGWGLLGAVDHKLEIAKKEMPERILRAQIHIALNQR